MTKKQRVWHVTIIQNGKAVGLPIAVESRIKPTRQAQQMAGEDDYTISDPISMEDHEEEELAWIKHLIKTGQL